MKLGTNIPILSPVLPIELPEETASLVNISESGFRAERSYGIYTICGSGKCKCDPSDPNRCHQHDGYIVKVLKARRGLIDQGDNSWSKQLGKTTPDLKNVSQFVIKAEDIGMDLVRQWNSDIWGIGSTITGEITSETVRGFAGCFVADGEKPTAEELSQAQQLLAASDGALVERAHSEWDQFHNPVMIHAGWKRAARRLGVDSEWLYSIVNKNALPDCPHCGSKLITATATVCATCGRDVVTQAAANGQERLAQGAQTASARKPRGGKKAAA
jgi:hypothetical protein